MGLFSRLKSLFGGFGVVTGKIEKNNLELLIADAEMRIQKPEGSGETIDRDTNLGRDGPSRHERGGEKTEGCTGQN